MLVVSVSSQGICALICVGETYVRGDLMPLKKTDVPPSSTGRFGFDRSADAVCEERFLPLMVTSVPTDTCAAAPPCVSVDPAAVAVMVEPLETVAEYEMLFPNGPGARAVSSTVSPVTSAVASTLGSPLPALIEFTTPLTTSVKASVASTLYV